MRRFQFTDNSVNTQGSRVLTEGIDMSDFLKNPVLFYQHADWRMPIGKWTEIEKDGDKLSGVPVFDDGDPLGQEIKRKVENGFLNAASVGLLVEEMSDEPSLLLPGQTRMTITKSRLQEISIVNFPANRSAYTMSFSQDSAPYAKREFLKLAFTPGPVLEIEPNTFNMKEISKALGLAEGATEAQIVEAVNTLKASAATSESLRTGFADVIGKVMDKLRLSGLKERAVGLATSGNIEAVSVLVETAVVPAEATQSLGDMLKASAGKAAEKTASDRSEWNIRDWEKKDPAGLLQMKQQQPDQYQEMYNKFYRK